MELIHSSEIQKNMYPFEFLINYIYFILTKQKRDCLEPSLLSLSPYQDVSTMYVPTSLHGRL